MKKIISLAIIVLVISINCYALEINGFLNNSNFENQLTSWSKYEDNAAVELSTEEKCSGDYGVKLTINDGGDASVWQTVPIENSSYEKGDKIKFSCMLNIAECDVQSTDFSCRLEVSNGNMQYFISKLNIAEYNPTKNKWIKFESEYVNVPKDTKYFIISAAGKTKGVFYVDDFSITFSRKQGSSFIKKSYDYQKTDINIDEIYYQKINNTFEKTIDVPSLYVNKQTDFKITAKGSGRVTLMLISIDKDGFESVIATSKNIVLSEEPSEIKTDLGVILKRTKKLKLKIIAEGECEVIENQ